MEEDGVVRGSIATSESVRVGNIEVHHDGCERWMKNCQGIEFQHGHGKFGDPVIPTIRQKKGFPFCFCCPSECQPLAWYTLWTSTTAYEVRHSLVTSRELCAFCSALQADPLVAARSFRRALSLSTQRTRSPFSRSRRSARSSRSTTSLAFPSRTVRTPASFAFAGETSTSQASAFCSGPSGSLSRWSSS